MRTSKYLNQTFDNGWKCVHVGIARVQAKKTKSGTLSKQYGRQSYYYIFERRTSDNKTDKMIRLNSQEAANVWNKKILVEEILDRREAKSDNKFTSEVYYERLK